jgi:formate dehydrogenase maturation protein FdhE
MFGLRFLRCAIPDVEWNVLRVLFAGEDIMPFRLT